jgi:hypothetical protein
MATKSATKKHIVPRMSDAAVSAKTGKVWKEWFAILDKAGAKKMSHQEIVQVLNSQHAVGPWWGQMVTATYEQARGLRARHEKPAGFEISVSRSLNVPVSAVYKAFATEKARTQWLDENSWTVRTAKSNQTMRVTWKDGKSSLDIAFYPKDVNKSQVVVQHGKLSDAKSAARMKTFWSAALDRLREVLKG